jgi:5'-deoxynucleotidase YfbR-like HD superfamily hydrolase
MKNILENALNSGTTYRYHCNTVMGRLLQTNADHQWGVVTIILMLHPNPSRSLLRAAHFHDGGEKWAGDLSGPFKTAHRDFADQHQIIERRIALEKGLPNIWERLTDEEERWLHFADKYESYWLMHKHGQPWRDMPSLHHMAQELGLHHEDLFECPKKKMWVQKFLASLSAMSTWRSRRKTLAIR